MTSLRRIATLAGTTVREAVRNRILYTLLFFAVVLIATGVLVSTLSYVERERIVQDVGFAAVRLFGVGIAIFVGVGLIHGEVERRTVYTILSKPLSRAEFLLGKVAGLVVVTWMLVAVMAAAFAVVSLLVGAPVDGAHAAAFLLFGVELLVVVSVASLFSSFSTPFLSALFTVGIWLVGHATRDLRHLGEQSDSAAVEAVTLWLHRLLPDLESLNLTIEAVHGLAIPASELGWALATGLLWSSALVTAAVIVFSRRDLR